MESYTIIGIVLIVIGALFLAMAILQPNFVVYDILKGAFSSEDFDSTCRSVVHLHPSPLLNHNDASIESIQLEPVASKKNIGGITS